MKPVVLCVDDEEIVRTALKEQLKRAFGSSLRIEAVESGEAALEVVAEVEQENAEFPVIIADQIMPGLKGDELLIEVHRRSARTLTILLTGQATADAVGNALNHANLYRYIAKPWERNDLVLTVKEAVRRYAQDKRLDEQNAELRQLNDELQHKIDAFFRFVPRDFLRLLGVDRRYEDVEVGLGVDVDLAVLFSDIRGFTSMAEKLTPAQCVDFVNRYISSVEPAISSHGGFVEHFAGDGVMVLFDGGADRAVRAGIEMSRRIARFSRQWVDEGHLPVSIGIGVNAGRLTLGTIGSPNRLKCGVVGDQVNLASRVEGLTRVYGVVMLVTSQVVERLADPGAYALRQVGRVLVKGRTTPVDVFEVLDAEEPEATRPRVVALPVFRRAAEHYYRAEFEQALAGFRECLATAPDDGVARDFRDRCEKQLAIGTRDDWTGVEVMAHK